MTSVANLYYVLDPRIDIINVSSSISVAFKGIVNALNLPFKNFKTERPIAANISTIPGFVGLVYVYTPDCCFGLLFLLFTSGSLSARKKNFFLRACSSYVTGYNPSLYRK